MKRALVLARKAQGLGEVPVGALVVRDGRVIGSGQNETVSSHDPSAHAEIIALRNAGRAAGNYRLPGCWLYVTLEPCCMCAGAIIHARLEGVVYAASDPKTGADGGRFDLLRSGHHNHRVEVVHGVLAKESSELLKGFFRQRR